MIRANFLKNVGFRVFYVRFVEEYLTDCEYMLQNQSSFFHRTWVQYVDVENIRLYTRDGVASKSGYSGGLDGWWRREILGQHVQLSRKLFSFSRSDASQKW